MIRFDLADVLQSEMGVELHVVAYFHHWVLVEDVGDLELPLQRHGFEVVSSLSFPQFIIAFGLLPEILFTYLEIPVLPQDVPTKLFL